MEKCPYCGGDLEKGTIQNGRRDLLIYYLPPEKNLPWLVTEKSIEKCGGIPLGGNNYEYWKSSKADAYICRKCRVGLFTF